MQPGTSWPPAPDVAPAAIAVDDLADAYDVIVIGAGAGGGVAACVLAEAGRRVLLVERGEALRRADLPRDHQRNARVFTGLERQVDPPVLGNPRFVGDVAVVPTEARWNNNAMTVGGGTRVYGAQAWRFSPEDFRMGSTYGAPFEDWPIAYDDVAPFYDRVEWEMGVCGPAEPRPYDGARQRGYPMPPIAPNASEPVLARGAQALGIATAAGPAADQLGALRRAPGLHPLRHLRRLRLPRRRQDRQPQHDDRARGRQRALRPAHRHRRHAAGHVGEHRRRSGARVRRPAPDRAARAMSWSPRARSRPRGCSWPAAWAPRTTRSGATSRATSYAGAVGVFDDQVQDSVGPGPSISTTDFRHHNDGILGGGILASEFVPIPIEAYTKLSAAGVVPAWGQAGVDALREAYTRTQFVVGPIQEVPAAASRVTLEPVRQRCQRHARRAPARRCARAERHARRRVPRAARGGVAASQRRPHRDAAAVGALEGPQRGSAPGRHLPHGHRSADVGDGPVGSGLGP